LTINWRYWHVVDIKIFLKMYTDGSQTEKGLGIGFGFAIYNHITLSIPLEPIHREFWNIGNRIIIYNGKLEGIIKAIEYTNKIAKEGEYFNIFIDN
jgi:hypothetical protein